MRAIRKPQSWLRKPATRCLLPWTSHHRAAVQPSSCMLGSRGRLCGLYRKRQRFSIEQNGAWTSRGPTTTSGVVAIVGVPVIRDIETIEVANPNDQVCGTNCTSFSHLCSRTLKPMPCISDAPRCGYLLPASLRQCVGAAWRRPNLYHNTLSSFSQAPWKRFRQDTGSARVADYRVVKHRGTLRQPVGTIENYLASGRRGV